MECLIFLRTATREWQYKGKGLWLRIRMIIAVSGHDGVFKLCFKNNGSLARWQLNKLFKGLQCN